MPDPASDVRGGTPPQASRKILLVEDDALIRMVASAMLEDDGFQVEEAGTGSAALAMLTADPTFGLMIVDLGLPDMGGGVVVAKAREFRPDLRVIIASGGAVDPKLTNVVLLPKPYDNATLTAAVRHAYAGGAASNA